MTADTNFTEDEPSEDSSHSSTDFEKHPFSPPGSPTKVATLKSFRDAYNGESYSEICSEASSPSGGSDTLSLKDFRQIYDAEKEDEGVLSQYSEGSSSTGKGSIQLQEHLAQLLSNTLDSSIPKKVGAKNDDVSSISSTSQQQWMPKMDSLALGTATKFLTQENGGLHSSTNEESSESESVDESLYAKPQQGGSTASLKHFHKALNSKSDSSALVGSNYHSNASSLKEIINFLFFISE